MGADVETHNRYAGQGPVMVDVGGDVGALVVAMPPEMTGVEVEIRPADSSASTPASHGHDHGHDHGGGHHAHHPHMAVVVRQTEDGPLPCLVYPSVAQGAYDLVMIGDESARRRVEVEGGVVTTTAWI
jgi:hypothetical protein